MMHSLRDRLLDTPLVASGAVLERYLVARLGDCRTEQLHALFLDAGNRLLRDERVAVGGPAEARVASRAIIARALALEAAAMLLVHNHPGGSLEPSPADISFTRDFAQLAARLGITLHDHLIIAGDACISLRARGLL